MPKPATTHPTKRIAGAPTRTPTTTRTTSAAPPMISRPVGPAAATAAGWAAPSTASVSLPRSAGYFAASAGGAKERVAQGGAHTSGVPARSAGGCAATGPLTQASAPISGSPRNRQIPWGESAPARLGREDPRNFGNGTLMLGGDGKDDQQGRPEDDQPQRRKNAADRREENLQRGARGLDANLQAPFHPHLSGMGGDGARDGNAGALGMEDGADEPGEILDAGGIGHLLQRIGTWPSQLYFP